MCFLRDLKYFMKLHNLARVSFKRQDRKTSPIKVKSPKQPKKTLIEYRDRLIIKVQKDFINHVYQKLIELKDEQA